MISIIIPVYNTGKYLKKCLGSILYQTYQDIEVILVDDGSKDDSLQKCYDFAKKDSRIKVIPKTKNEGIELARFTGLNNSSGEYIMFIDNDDWLANNNILKKMYEKAEETKVDYVEMGVNRVLDRHGIIKKKYNNTITGLISQPELFDKYFISYFGINILSVNIWAKLYRKSSIDKSGLKPLGLLMSDDLAFNMQLLPNIEKIYILNENAYNYAWGGTTSKYNRLFFPDAKKLFKIKMDLIEKYQYHKAENSVRWEMKNVLKSDIIQKIQLLKNDKKYIIQDIATEIKNPIYDIVLDIPSESNFWKDPFTIALKDKDAERLYDICYHLIKKNRLKRNFKRMLAKVLNII